MMRRSANVSIDACVGIAQLCGVRATLHGCCSQFDPKTVAFAEISITFAIENCKRSFTIRVVFLQKKFANAVAKLWRWRLICHEQTDRFAAGVAFRLSLRPALKGVG
jgi:hypothetical protein